MERAQDAGSRFPRNSPRLMVHGHHTLPLRFPAVPPPFVANYFLETEPLENKLQKASKIAKVQTQRILGVFFLAI